MMLAKEENKKIATDVPEPWPMKLIFNILLFCTIIFLSKLAGARPFILGRKKS